MFEFYLSQIHHFGIFRNEIISYFTSFLDNKLTKKNKNATQKFVTNVFTKWWFFTYLVGNNSGWFPSKFYVQDDDLEYFFKSRGQKTPQLNYDTKLIQSLLDKYINDTCTNIMAYENINPIITNRNNPYVDVIIGSDKYKISQKQWQGLVARFKEDELTLEEATAVEVLRLANLGSIMEHLSIPPKLLIRLGIDTELFGTPLNTSLPKFCSPFPDIEKQFGSQGSFLNYKLQSGKRYTFNPPYDLELMNICIIKLLDQLKSTPDLQIIAILPVWDPQTQKELGLKQHNTEFKGFNDLLDSGYVYDRTVLDKDSYPYFDYFSSNLIPASTTHCIILTNNQTSPWSISDIETWWNQ